MTEKEIQKELRKRYEMGQTLKRITNMALIDTRLVTIFRDKDDDGFMQVRVKDIDDENVEMKVRYLDMVGTKEFNVKELDDNLLYAAKEIVKMTQYWLDYYPDTKFIWSWLGN